MRAGQSPETGAQFGDTSHLRIVWEIPLLPEIMSKMPSSACRTHYRLWKEVAPALGLWSEATCSGSSVPACPLLCGRPWRGLGFSTVN